MTPIPIRNELGQRGHDPLLFFLKCLKDNDPRLPELIREETTRLASAV